MKTAVRVLVALAGILGLIATLSFWLSPGSAATGVGLLPIDAKGLASVRADLAGFFGAQTLFAFLTAWKGRAEYALPPIVLMSFALFGRVLSIAFGGFDPAIVAGMAVEAIMIALFAFAWRTLRTA